MKERTTVSATTICTLAFLKFIEGGTGELAKRFTGKAIEEMDCLRQKMWQQLRGQSGWLDSALARVEAGEQAALQTVAKNLDVAMDEDSDFAAEVQAIAQSIQVGKLMDRSGMTQNNSDNAQGFQTKVEGGTAYIGDIYVKGRSYKSYVKKDGSHF